MNSVYKKLSIESNESDYNYNSDELYDEQRECLKTILTALGSILLIYTITNDVLNLKNSEKSIIKASLYQILKKSFKIQSENEINILNEILKNNISNNYYKKTYILSLGSSINIKKLDDKIIKKIIDGVVEGKNWSDRIWNNKSNLEKILRRDIKNILDGKVNVNEIERLIKKRFNTNAYVTKRLVENEIARCQSEINDYFANTYDLEYQLFTATLDNKTTDKCRGLDGKIFEVNDPNKPRIPQDTHILCRSCYINIPSREWRPKTRMNNITKNNDSIWKNYSKWYQENIGD